MSESDIDEAEQHIFSAKVPNGSGLFMYVSGRCYWRIRWLFAPAWVLNRILNLRPKQNKRRMSITKKRMIYRERSEGKR